MLDEHYKTLSLKHSADNTAEDIKKAYRKLCKIHHPDKGGSAEAFAKIHHAYRSLTDPSYKHESEKLNLNIAFQVPISFNDAFFGRKITTTFAQFEIDENKNIITKEHQEVHLVVVDYPAGHFGTFEKTFADKGVKFKNEVGVAKLSYVVAEHPQFKLGQNGCIVSTERIDLEVLLKGGTIVVQTMFGLKDLKINAGTSPNKRLRIPNCGVNGQSDHLVQIEVVYPTENEIKTKKKFKDLVIPEENFSKVEPQNSLGFTINIPSGYYYRG